jgi:hypothetical protein
MIRSALCVRTDWNAYEAAGENAGESDVSKGDVHVRKPFCNWPPIHCDYGLSLESCASMFVYRDALRSAAAYRVKLCLLWKLDSNPCARLLETNRNFQHIHHGEPNRVVFC